MNNKEKETKAKEILKNTEAVVSPFTSDQPLPSDATNLHTPEFKTLYYLYLDLLAARQSDEFIISSLEQKSMVAFGFPQPIAAKVAALAFSNFSSPAFAAKFVDTFDTTTRTDASKLFVSTLDLDRLKTLTSKDPHNSSTIRKILLALIANYRRNFHKSGWVKYDKKFIFYLAGVNTLSPKELEETTQYLHQEYGLNMQVVGSNSPIPCYKIDWLFDQPQPGSHINPFLDLGPFSPETISIVSAGDLDSSLFKKII